MAPGAWMWCRINMEVFTVCYSWGIPYIAHRLSRNIHCEELLCLEEGFGRRSSHVFLQEAGGVRPNDSARSVELPRCRPSSHLTTCGILAAAKAPGCNGLGGSADG